MKMLVLFVVYFIVMMWQFFIVVCSVQIGLILVIYMVVLRLCSDCVQFLFMLLQFVMIVILFVIIMLVVCLMLLMSDLWQLYRLLNFDFVIELFMLNVGNGRWLFFFIWYRWCMLVVVFLVMFLMCVRCFEYQVVLMLRCFVIDLYSVIFFLLVGFVIIEWFFLVFELRISSSVVLLLLLRIMFVNLLFGYLKMWCENFQYLLSDLFLNVNIGVLVLMIVVVV